MWVIMLMDKILIFITIQNIMMLLSQLKDLKLLKKVKSNLNFLLKINTINNKLNKNKYL